MRAKTYLSLTTLVLFLAQLYSHANEQVNYLTQIKPILESKCYACHGAIKQEGGLRLETRTLMLAGSDSGDLFQPGHGTDSLLVERIAAEEDYRMPPADEGAALKPEEIERIKNWIDQGAIAPEEEIPLGPQDHWAFKTIQKPDLPQTKTAYDNPIDTFLAAKREKHALQTQPEAQRSILLRRLYLDLTGLPPTLVQLRDSRPWETIVDELLASPHHGERWARHWMDIWRYTDWYGLGAQLRNSQKHIWRWRDWIVESLNTNKPFDRMILEMIAGDELAPENPDVLVGTGFLARNYYLFNRTTWLDSTIEHTGKALLGLTLNCAKCHDHKYDPISQHDYYRLRAIFEPHQVRLDPVPGVTDFEKDGLPRVFDDHLDIKTYLHVRGDPKNIDKETPIEPGVPTLFDHFIPAIEPVRLPVSAYAPAVRDYVQQDRLAAAKAEVANAQSKLEEANQKLAVAQQAEITPPSNESEEQEFYLHDDFDQPNPALWELIGKSWQYTEGTLQQTEASRNTHQARLLERLPQDFELTCRFTTTGGTTYKSVTINFDQSQDDSYSNLVYTSAHEPAPKVQIATRRSGKNNYPSAGRVAKTVTVGTPYELRVAVRDTLINVWLDNEFLLAYALPDRRPEGSLSLSGFDASVAFDFITIKSLPASTKLTPTSDAQDNTVEKAEKNLKLATAKFAAAEAAVSSLQATIAADNAVYLETQTPEKLQKLKAAAAQQQLLAKKAKAQYDILADADDSKKLKSAQDSLRKTEQQLAKLENNEPIEYTPLRASRKALETPEHKETDYAASYPKSSTGRRLAFARWITSSENPLTARVAVNQVWMRHFGEPLVEPVFDFGLRTKPPVQAELLDYLAADFIESGWDFKHLHRLIVTSKAYRLSTSTKNSPQENLTTDPNNKFYWRMNTRRMESQVVRDSLLYLAGELDAQLGGPSVDPDKESKRRSLYLKHSRDQQEKFLTMFDDADLLQCYRRSESIVPQQALALANSKLSLSMAEQIAAKLASQLDDTNQSEFIALAFETLLGRQPEESERLECETFCAQIAKLTTDQSTNTDELRVQTRLVHALLNHNDFISIR